MPQVYTIATKNAFSVLDDSDSEDHILSEMPVEPVKAVPPPKQVDTAATEPSRKPASRRANNNDSSDRPPRRQRNAENEAGESERRPARFDGPRPPRAYNGEEGVPRTRPARPPKTAQTDRLSGTGRGREMKKEGGGAHNWGNQTQDFGADLATKQAEVETDGEALGTAVEATAEEVVVREEGPKTISYSAYKADQEGKRAALPQREVTVDSEADKAQYLQQGYEVYTKESKQPVSEKKVEDDEKARPKVMHLAELAAQSGMQLRFGGDRRGPRNRNDQERGPKPGETEKKAPATKPRHEINLADSQAFPTLEAH